MDYTEHLIVDRETENLEHIQNIGTGCKVSRKYEIEGGIESLLENFNAEDLFSHIEGNPDDVIDTPNETKDYKITIDCKKSPQRVIEGNYDKNGLPEDFAETVFDFMDWERLLIHRFTARQSAANRNIFTAALPLMRDKRVIICRTMTASNSVILCLFRLERIIMRPL